MLLRMLRRRQVIARLGRRLLLRILVSRLLRYVSRSRNRISLRRLLWIIRSRLLTRARIQIVSASALAISRRWIVITGGVPTIKKPTRHLAHALAKLGQKLQRALILGLGLLRVTVAGGRLLIAGRGRVLLLRVTTLLRRVTLSWLIIALLLCLQ